MPALFNSDAPRVLRLPANTRGVDYVTGDIHGMFGLLKSALTRVRFDPQKDRLFSVGDLINRGPSSPRVEKFLKMPGVHAVQGNHEATLLEVYSNGEPPPDVVHAVTRFNGMKWWRDVNRKDRMAILAAISQLPLAIEVQTSTGKVGIVHADVPADMDWETFLHKLQVGHPGVMDTCLWSRTRVTLQNEQGVEGIDRVYVGHTPQWAGVTVLGNVAAIDTGAVFQHRLPDPAGRLTLVRLDLPLAELTGPPSNTGEPFDLYCGPALENAKKAA